MVKANLLSFGKGNAKLGKAIYTFSLPSGYSCPFARECLSKAEKSSGKIKDGPHTKFRCFSASQESLYKNVRDSRWRNFEMLREAQKAATHTDKQYYQGAYAMAKLIMDSLPRNADVIRIHVGGDFWSLAYMRAWAMVAKLNPKKLFYTYTKSLPYWEVLGKQDALPTNLVLTASYGGHHDKLITSLNLRFAKVVYSEEQAKTEGLEIDHDDSHAMRADGKSFALLIHGTQPAGSEASKAKSKLKGKGSYSRKR